MFGNIGKGLDSLNEVEKKAKEVKKQVDAQMAAAREHELKLKEEARKQMEAARLHERQLKEAAEEQVAIARAKALKLKEEAELQAAEAKAKAQKLREEVEARAEAAREQAEKLRIEGEKRGAEARALAAEKAAALKKKAEQMKAQAEAKAREMQKLAEEQAKILREKAEEAMNKAKGMIGTLPRNETEGIIFILQKMNKSTLHNLILSDDIDIPIDRLDKICGDLSPQAIEKVLDESNTLFQNVKKFDMFLKDPSIELLAKDKGLKNLVFKVMKDSKNPIFHAMKSANPGMNVLEIVGTMDMAIKLYILNKQKPYLKFVILGVIVGIIAIYLFFLISFIAN